MDYDYSLIEVTRSEADSFAVDATLFVENYWGKDALARLPSLELKELASQPFDATRVEELRKTVGDWLVSQYTPPTAASTEAPEEEVTIELKEETPPETLGFDEATLDRIRKIQFQIHNTVRSYRTRSKRYTARVQRRFVQYVTSKQIRLMRGRPIAISGETLLAHLPQLRAQHAMGVLEVRTLHGQRLIDLTTLDIADSAISPPRPRPLMDSVKRDQNQGIGEFVPPFQGALPVDPPEEPVAPIPPPMDRPSSAPATATLPPAIPVVKKTEEKPLKKKVVPR